jgi:hypothetical protein
MTFRMHQMASITALILASSTASATLYTLANEFSDTANPSGVWSFGQTDLGTGFTTYTAQGSNGPLRSWDNGSSVVHHNTSANVYDLGTARYLANTAYFHPGPSSNQDATIRFTAPVAGQYELDADFWHADRGGNGAVVSIYLNGVLQGLTLSITGDDPDALTPYDLIRTLSMAAGDHLDIALDNAGAYDFDAVGVRALIRSTDPGPAGVPEPASLALVAAGLFAAVRRRKVG